MEKSWKNIGCPIIGFPGPRKSKEGPIVITPGIGCPKEGPIITPQAKWW